MTTEELIKAAKELVELDGKRTPGKWEPQLAEAVRMYRKLGHTTVGPKTTQDGEFCVHAANNSAKIARAFLALATKALS